MVSQKVQLWRKYKNLNPYKKINYKTAKIEDINKQINSIEKISKSILNYRKNFYDNNKIIDFFNNPIENNEISFNFNRYNIIKINAKFYDNFKLLINQGKVYRELNSNNINYINFVNEDLSNEVGSDKETKQLTFLNKNITLIWRRFNKTRQSGAFFS